MDLSYLYSNVYIIAVSERDCCSSNIYHVTLRACNHCFSFVQFIHYLFKHTINCKWQLILALIYHIQYLLLFVKLYYIMHILGSLASETNGHDLAGVSRSQKFWGVW